MSTAPARSVNRQILALALPALGALVAEPLFLLADSAIVGHLGVTPLAGLALAATVLTTAVGLSVFLAYGATAAVARRVGAGDLRGALRHGVDGMWLSVAIGVVLLAVLLPGGRVLVELLGGQGEVARQGATYLRWSALGLPPMLLVLACTGVLRGLQRTMPPLVVAAIGAAVNVGLNLLLVYGLDLGIAGSAIGTVVVQYLMAAALVVAVFRAAGPGGLPLRPSLRRIGHAGRAGFPVFLRTLTLRIAVLLTVMVGATKGDVALAGLQVTFNVWNLLALALDAIAIAAQALTGHALGAGDAAATRSLTRRMLQWACGAGVVLGALLAVSAPFVGRLFSPDPAVIAAVTAACFVLAVGQLLSGWVFVLDGVLLGAGDGRYLAVAGVVNLLVYLPALALTARLAPDGTAGLVWLWAVYAGVYMLARAVTLGWRYRGDRWLILGT
ncbi:MATE family efflux transporter [Nakamurella deserti]|uniref:MATE family efflux transporter n=1 Tax=Nakamurella deserti TaxID=2164074 RepID=UPI000DBEA437|nr:MATE family efflux transporter [Nakamurella deserti]